LLGKLFHKIELRGAVILLQWLCHPPGPLWETCAGFAVFSSCLAKGEKRGVFLSGLFRAKDYIHKHLFTSLAINCHKVPSKFKRTGK
jgi:hypothetical protein